MNPKTLESLIWVLIYGGLIGVCLGLAVSAASPTTGTVLSVGGGVIAALGVVLIFVRARMKGQ